MKKSTIFLKIAVLGSLTFSYYRQLPGRTKAHLPILSDPPLSPPARHPLSGPFFWVMEFSGSFLPLEEGSECVDGIEPVVSPIFSHKSPDLINSPSQAVLLLFARS